MRLLLGLFLSLLSFFPAWAFAAVIKVVLLGTGGPIPDAERAGPAVLIEAGGQRLLFDAGRNTTTRLWQAGYSPAQVDAVFITHLHSDHVVGMADLWLTGWIWQRPKPLRVFGPDGTAEFARHHEAAYAFDLRVRSMSAHGLDREAGALQAEEINAGAVHTFEGVRVTAFSVDHGDVRPALGYRIDYAGRSVVISGDTRPSSNLQKHARGVDVLIHELAEARSDLADENARLRRILDYHTTPAGLLEVLEESRPRLTVLVHVLLFGLDHEAVMTSLRENYPGRILMGEDLMWIDVGEDLTVRESKPLPP